jgi:hypothetical protein
MFVDPQVFRWASVKQQLKLEALGLKSSGGALRPRMCAELGLKASAPYADFLAAVQARLDAARAAA